MANGDADVIRGTAGRTSGAFSNSGAVFAAKAREFHLVIALGVVLIIAGMVNATSIYDDLYLAEHFRASLRESGVARTLLILFFSLDLHGAQYRFYGLSKILHLVLWEIAGTRAWVYGGTIAAAQFASGLGILRLLGGMRVERFQAWAVTLVWMLSPFAVTTCFHHYCYLLLPYDLTVVAALVVQKGLESGAVSWRRYVVLAVLAFAIANTGEAHIPAALVILTFVTFATPAAHLKGSRFAALALFASVIVVSICLHRLWWSAHTPHSEIQRYVFAIPNFVDGQTRTSRFFGSLPAGIATQVDAIVTFAGYRALLTAAVVAALGVFLWRKRWSMSGISAGGLGLPAALVLTAVAGIVTVWALGLLSGQVYGIYPRRYGYVPNTVVAMALVGFLAAPAVRRFTGRAPAFGSLLLIGWLWLTLVAACLPTVRSQDHKVWKAIARALREKPDADVLFASVTNYVDPSSLSVISAGLRGIDFPETFESPLSNCWWESKYASVLLGARYAGCHFDGTDSAQVRLTGLGMYDDSVPVVVPQDSIVIVADTGLHPPDWRHRAFSATLFTKWPDFEGSLAAHGADIATGWDQFRRFPESGEVAIDVGDPAAAGDVLPDKQFSDPARGMGLVVNYGIEAGNGGMFTPPHGGPSSWWITNWHGSFTYRIDFADRAPRIVALDWLDYWHASGSARRMILDAAADDQWYRVGIIDPAAEAGTSPLVLKLPTGGAKTFRIRLQPAPAATDVPFLAGIRILPAQPSAQ